MSHRTYAHTGEWQYHDDDCQCAAYGGRCNRDAHVWSCCGSLSKDSTCTNPASGPSIARGDDQVPLHRLRTLAPGAVAPGVIELECPRCHEVTRVPASYGGRRGKCPGCKTVIEVPRAGEGAPAPAPAVDPAADREACPYCGEDVARSASRCRHCGERLGERLRAARKGGGEDDAERAGEPHIVRRMWGVLIIGLSCLGLVLVIMGWSKLAAR